MSVVLSRGPARRILLIAIALVAMAVGLALEAREVEQMELLGANPERTEQLGTLSVGPDVTIIDMESISNYTDTTGGEEPSPCPPGYGTGGEDCRGYALGTNSCNIGSYPVDWCDQVGGCRQETSPWHEFAPAASDDHSVIAHNLYKLKDGRFTQIGASFLKHGFVSTNSNDTGCVWNDNGNPNTSCVQPAAGGDQLGLGCTDFYGSGLNGSRPLGRRSDVHVAGGDHPTNPAGGESTDDHDQRIVVAESDLDPSLNAGAVYFGEGHYVVRDDARAGNGLNNASYREITVGAMPNLNLSFTGPTVRELPAVFGWQAEDPQVEIVSVDRQVRFAGEQAEAPIDSETYSDYFVTERYHAARRVTTGAEGLAFHYEYVLYNMNSFTSAVGFEIDLGTAATIANVGFHGLAHHSGEPYDTEPWRSTVDGAAGIVRWDAIGAGEDTNALRWGTTFSFWFDSDVGPQPAAHRVRTFCDDAELVAPFPGGLDTPNSPVDLTAGVECTLLPTIFEDGFESGDTSAWSSDVP